MMEIIVW